MKVIDKAIRACDSSLYDDIREEAMQMYENDIRQGGKIYIRDVSKLEKRSTKTNNLYFVSLDYKNKEGHVVHKTFTYNSIKEK